MLSTEYTTRTQRAQRILEAGLVTPWDISAGEWRVKSESNETTTYNVNVKTGTCACPDHTNGHYCKHLLAALRAAKIYARPKRVEWHEEIDAEWPPAAVELELIEEEREEPTEAERAREYADWLKARE